MIAKFNSLNIVCVLRSGGEYLPEHVYKLKEMCEKHMPKHQFVCISDSPLECMTIQLKNNWPGWWSKMELFNLDLGGPILYLDLDTVIRGDCSEIVDGAKSKGIVVLRDFYRGNSNSRAIGSGIMYMDRPMRFIYNEFCSGAKKHMQENRGDQDFLEKVIPPSLVGFFQDFTGSIASYKVDVAKRGLMDSDKIIAFHGNPKPWSNDVIKLT